MEGNLRFKIDWASLVVGSKFTVFALFTLYLRVISKYDPPGTLYLEGRYNGGFFPLRVSGAGLLFGGPYFRNFTVLDSKRRKTELKLILS